MRLITWAAAWSGAPESATERPFSKRSVPPHLVHAIDQERLHWALYIKGLDRGRAMFFCRDHQAVGRTNEDGVGPRANVMGRDFNIHAALREIERVAPHPALLPRGREAQRRMRDVERWFCQEVAPAVLWRLNPPVSSQLNEQSDPDNASMYAPIRKALDLVAGLTRKHCCLMGEELTFADIAAASVLAPVAREMGWAWADTQGTAARVFHTSGSWREHPGAAWVREFYEQHGTSAKQAEEPQRAWLP
jgi:glutathione S-transferase